MTRRRAAALVSLLTIAPGFAAGQSADAAARRTEQGLARSRELGKLKDAGYLTDAEFQRINQRILDSHF